MIDCRIVAGATVRPSTLVGRCISGAASHPRKNVRVLCCTLGEPCSSSRLFAVPRPTMKRILVGVDGSPESRAAAHKAAELSGALGAQLLIAYVIAPFPTISPSEFGAVVQDWDAA